MNPVAQRLYLANPSYAWSETMADGVKEIQRLDREVTRLRSEVEQHKQEALSFHSIGCELSEDNDRLRSINAELLAVLVSINEYWNGSDSKDAMWDACLEMTERASRAIAHATATTPSEKP